MLIESIKMGWWERGGGKKGVVRERRGGGVREGLRERGGGGVREGL